MINIALCDDDPMFTKEFSSKIKLVLQEQHIPCNIICFLSGGELIKQLQLQRYHFDLVLLDIDMPDMNGLKVAQKLREIDMRMKLIFVSAYEQEVFNTFAFRPDSFLPKNLLDLKLNEELLRTTQDIIESRVQLEVFNVCIQESRITIAIPISDISCFECLNRQVYVHLQGKNSYRLNGVQFEDIAEKYIKRGFVRTHRSCIVNLLHVCSVDTDTVVLRNDKKVPLTRRRKKDFMLALSRTLGRLSDDINILY